MQLSLGGCNYVADRGLDFLDQYRVAIGLGSVAGLRFRNLGLVDSGLMIGVKPKAAALGWKYGTPLFFHEKDTRLDADQAEIIKTTSIIDLDYAKGTYWSARNSAAILPAIFTWTDATPRSGEYAWLVPEKGDCFDDRHWLWSGAAFGTNRYAQIHAFDNEFEIGFLVYLDVGWSLGESFDFLLGLFTIDLAKDDSRL
jgi:hypothetical protein